MLELRLTTDAKRIASMRAAVARECTRARAGDEHAANVATIIELLIGTDRSDRRAQLFVVVTVQSDATMVMVRDSRPDHGHLGPRRHEVLEANTLRWSTMSGKEGRTIWAEIVRPAVAAEPPVAPAPAAAPAPAGSGAAVVRLAPMSVSRFRRGVPCAP